MHARRAAKFEREHESRSASSRPKRSRASTNQPMHARRAAKFERELESERELAAQTLEGVH